MRSGVFTPPFGIPADVNNPVVRDFDGNGNSDRGSMTRQKCSSPPYFPEAAC